MILYAGQQKEAHIKVIGHSGGGKSGYGKRYGNIHYHMQNRQLVGICLYDAGTGMVLCENLEVGRRDGRWEEGQKEGHMYTYD